MKPIIQIAAAGRCRKVRWLLLAGVLIPNMVLGATCIPPTPDGAGLQSCLTSALPGDTIILKEGTYIPASPLVFPGPAGKTFFINKRLTIRGRGPRVVLSGDMGGGDQAYNVVVISADASPGMVRLENLTIEKGNSSGGGFFVGGAIVAGPNQMVSLDNVSIRDNTAVLGGGLWLGAGGNWTINNSIFQNNAAIDSGGAIGAGGANLLEVSDGVFDGNTANGFAGGAIHFNAFGSLSVKGATFSNNTTGESGGAISIQGVGPGNTYSIEDCTFRSNRAIAAEGIGGAVDIFSIINEGSITKSTFQYNTATTSGGAVYISRGYSTLSDNRFLENQSIYGGAVGVQGGEEHGARNTNVTFTRNTLEDNTGSIGGALLAFDIVNPATQPGDVRFSALTFDKNHYRRNSASMIGGAVVISNAENLRLTKEYYSDNWSDGAVGALAIEFTSGHLNNIHFNQNGANEAPGTLLMRDSPDLVVSEIHVADDGAGNCSIQGVSGCP